MRNAGFEPALRFVPRQRDRLVRLPIPPVEAQGNAGKRRVNAPTAPPQPEGFPPVPSGVRSLWEIRLRPPRFFLESILQRTASRT